MGLMDKFKNLFTEEVEEEVIEEPKKTVKVEKTQVEIASPTPKRSEKHNDFVPLDEPEVLNVEEPKEEEYKFPFFDDTDFETIEKKEEKKEKKKSSYRKEVYNPPKPEKKVFKPTPIISPVYGILDKNYQKEDIVPKPGNGNNYSNPKEDMIDAFRNKAYGTLEDDIETTLFGNNRVLFDDNPEAKDLADDIKIEEVSDKPEEKEEYGHVLISDRPRHGFNEEDDLTDLLEQEMEKDVKEEEKKPKPISDEELFSMIDSMYEKGDKRSWLIF